MPDPVSADYTLRPSELAGTLALLVEARQPAIVWGSLGCTKSQIAQQVAAEAGREYVDVRALLLDPVDLRGARHALRADAPLGRPGQPTAHGRQLRALYRAHGRLAGTHGARARPFRRGL